MRTAKVAPLAVEISEAQLWTAITAVTGTLALAVGFLLKNWIKEKEERLLEMKTQRDDYKRVAGSTVEAYEQLILRQLSKRGIAAAELVAPVVPEHHSPTTEKQQEQAEFATIQARRVAADVALGKLLAAEEASTNELPKPEPKPVPVMIVASEDSPLKVEVIPADDPLPVEIVPVKPVPVKIVDEEKK